MEDVYQNIFLIWIEKYIFFIVILLSLFKLYYEILINFQPFCLFDPVCFLGIFFSL